MAPNGNEHFETGCGASGSGIRLHQSTYRPKAFHVPEWLFVSDVIA